MSSGLTLRGALLFGASFVSLSAAQAQDARPSGSEESPEIVGTTVLNPNAPPPAGILDNTVNITGVGQFAIRPSQATTGLSVCTATLINPRTVILAAHCVNTRPANAYGTNIAGGATAASVGFQFNNLPAIRQWLGLPSAPGGTDANPALRNATNLARSLFAVEQVAYHPGSLTNPAALGFIQADIALATLDTRADDIPTWALLFSPLDEPTHAVLNGYGATGTSGTSGANIGVDFRRRAAENMISFLGSLDDRNNWLFCPGSTGCPFTTLPQSLYQLDFDSPGGQAAYNPATGAFDFDLFNGAALPREGTTAGGDSGGPLIADQAFDRKVVVGVLSGGSRFFGAQPFSSFGTSSFYQPLFLYWDWIVANNPYKYVTNLAGDADWTDATHWVQTMDPNYTVARDGQLVNALPGNLGLTTSTNTTKFGEVCFLDDCLDVAQAGTEDPGIGAGLTVPGGPGSTNFVPNNVRAAPLAGVSARYYDVTLSAAGTTRATTSIEIDKLTIDGPAKLDVQGMGNLTVLGDFTQMIGWTNVDGRLKTGEALVVKGLLSGSGTFDPTFLTVAAGVVAPGGGDKVGTLTVQGDVILASASALFIDAFRGSADKLAVTGDAANPGSLTLSNASLVFNKVTDKAAPRDGEKYTIATATGGISGTFGTVYSFQGVLRPELSYDVNKVTATLRAGSLVTILDGATPTAVAFAAALDTLRTSSYNSLWNLYGAVDLMGPGQLAATLDGLAPRTMGESGLLQDRQSRMLMSNVIDRLSLAGTGAGSGITVIGDAHGFAPQSGTAATRHAFAGLAPSSKVASRLPEGVSGFVAAGTLSGESSYGDSARLGGGRSGNWMGMGLEFRVADRTTVGTATGFASATSRPGADRVDSRTLQVAGYATHELGGGAYVGAVGSLEMAHLEQDRIGFDGSNALALTGASDSSRIGVMAEAGKRIALGGGLAVTPRVRLAYDRHALEGFRERGGETALAVDTLVRERLEAKLGFALAGTGDVGGGWRVTPQLQADVARRVAGSGDVITVRFAGAPDAAIALPLADGARTWAEARGALALDNGRVAFTVGAETAFGAANRDDRAVAGFTVRF